MIKRFKKGFTLVELMIVVAIIGILAAIAIPNFIRFQARSKQAEAKTNLKAIFTGQKSFYAEKDRYAGFNGEIGFAPERGNRYGYTLAAGVAAAACEDRSTATPVFPAGGATCVTSDLYRYPSAALLEAIPGAPGATAWAAASTGVTVPTAAEGGNFGVCPATCSFQASARGNLDNDPAIDYQSVSSEFMTITVGACNEQQDNVQPGASAQLYNDVSCDTN